MEKNLFKLVAINNAEFVEGCELPTLALKDSDGNIHGYLMPIKGYKFQVCSDTKGNWDLGSSEVVGLGNVVTADYTRGVNSAKNPRLSVWSSNSSDLAKSFLNALVWNALSDFTSRAADRASRIGLNDFRQIIYVEHSLELCDKVRELCELTVEYINSVI